MDDLFRFLLLRQANVVPEDDVNVVTPTFVGRGSTLTAARAAAAVFTQDKQVILSTGSLTYAKAARAVVLAARSGAISASDLDALLVGQTGKGAAAIAADAAFGEEATHLKDSLAAMKLQSSSLGGDAPGLGQLIQGYDAVQLAATGRDPIKLRALSLTDYQDPPRSPPAETGGAASPPTPPAPPSRTGPSVAEIDKAIATLSAVPVTGFHGADDVRIAAATPAPTERAAAGVERVPAQHSDVPPVTQAWLLSADAISGLPPAVQQTVLDLGSTSGPSRSRWC